jgi:hypothetical protein
MREGFTVEIRRGRVSLKDIVSTDCLGLTRIFEEALGGQILSRRLIPEEQISRNVVMQQEIRMDPSPPPRRS